MLRKLIQPLRIARAIINELKVVRRGFIALRTSKLTPEESKRSMLNLFCETRGLSNEVLHFFIKRSHPKLAISYGPGVLNFQSADDVRAAAKKIRKDGFCVFNEVIDPVRLRQLYKFATTQKARVRPLLDKGPDYKLPERIISLNKPSGIRYDFTEGQVIDLPAAQDLFTDTSIVSLAQEYLGCAPVMKLAAMWWHTDFSKEANDESATMWHFDMDYIRWLNFFFYLTDVTP